MAKKTELADPVEAVAEPRLARLGPVLALALTGAVALGAGLLLASLWVMGFPALAAVGTAGLPLARLLDLVKLSFGIIAGVGGTIALVVAYRRQKVLEAAERRQQRAERREDTKLFNERFATAADQLGHDSPAVRLAGIHALAGLADEAPSRGLRQTMIDVLCAFLRVPNRALTEGQPSPADVLEFGAMREIRRTILRIVTARLRDEAPNSWHGYDFDFSYVEFDEDDFAGVTFSGGVVDFTRAIFTGAVSFADIVVVGARVQFRRAHLSADIDFSRAKFLSGSVDFDAATVARGTIMFAGAEFGTGVASFAGLTVGADGRTDFRLATGQAPRGLADAARKSRGVDLPPGWLSSPD
ncbi:hypothetical protein Acor_72740 [Acrocarpospora corrugata]|uniref:Pentapeptide repeat-containing protein n=1 Tax=Acrocarpospora corrugata TaxID=35763 RepID=A0A5M3W8P8_9ACTN|nr:pentapeptide repeat-containing protein [Acrocarpospora corrugata]GES05206.1 hypothetical protein Acor_72740 [Acrocarpospora corrugata]